jgi:ketosteroid isomerase-like protein
VVRRAYAAADAAIESGDLDSFLGEFYDPNAQYEPIEEGASLRGQDEIAEYFRRWLDVWDDFRWEVEELIDAGNQVLSAALLSGRADSSGVEISQRIFYVTELRNLKVVRVREFLDRGEALAAAGLQDG